MHVISSHKILKFRRNIHLWEPLNTTRNFVPLKAAIFCFFKPCNTFSHQNARAGIPLQLSNSIVGNKTLFKFCFIFLYINKKIIRLFITYCYLCSHRLNSPPAFAISIRAITWITCSFRALIPWEVDDLKCQHHRQHHEHFDFIIQRKKYFLWFPSINGLKYRQP